MFYLNPRYCGLFYTCSDKTCSGLHIPCVRYVNIASKHTVFYGCNNLMEPAVLIELSEFLYTHMKGNHVPDK